MIEKAFENCFKCSKVCSKGEKLRKIILNRQKLVSKNEKAFERAFEN